MVVADYMVTNLATLDDQAKLLDAVLLVRQTGFRHIPIVDQAGRLQGILTDRDIARITPSMLAPLGPDEYNRLFEATSVTLAMSRDPVTVRPDTPIADAVARLHHDKLGALPVVDDSGTLVGILTVTDMLGLLHNLLRDRAHGAGRSG